MFFNVAVLDFRIDIDPEIMKRGSFTAIKPPISSRREGRRHFSRVLFFAQNIPKSLIFGRTSKQTTRNYSILKRIKKLKD